MSCDTLSRHVLRTLDNACSLEVSGETGVLLCLTGEPWCACPVGHGPEIESSLEKNRRMPLCILINGAPLRGIESIHL